MMEKIGEFVLPRPPAGWMRHDDIEMPAGHTAAHYSKPASTMRVLIGLESTGWHLSVSLDKRLPKWSELRWCRERFLPRGITFAQILPGDDRDYVNMHPNCLHLWEMVTTKGTVAAALAAKTEEIDKMRERVRRAGVGLPDEAQAQGREAGWSAAMLAVAAHCDVRGIQWDCGCSPVCRCEAARVTHEAAFEEIAEFCGRAALAGEKS